jgi:hypothetical protein
MKKRGGRRIWSLRNKVNNKIWVSSARFIGLSRRVSRPAVLRLVAFETIITARFNGLFRGFSHFVGYRPA